VADGRPGRDEEFAAYYAARGAAMRGTAYLLCGDWHLAEDLTQTAFAKLYLAWSRISRREAIDAYVRRVIVRAFLDERRRPWRRERVTAPDGGAFEQSRNDPEVVERLAIQAALAAVPPRQRATLVLRYWADLSVEETAQVLGCSAGTVKSQTARGLATLRGVLGGAVETGDERYGGVRR
jgi:RNA polymerase sigma-70 factor (sigma-E family)